MAGMNSMKEKILDMFKDFTKMNDIDRDNLKDLLKSESDGHKTFVKILDSLSKNDMQKFKEKLNIVIPSSKVKEVSSWQEYLKSLQTKASTVEHNRLFDSLVRTREAYIKIIDDAISKINKVFPDEMISFSQLRKSQLFYFGLVVQSMILSNWSLYTWTLLSALTDGTENEIPKYRLNYISKYVKNVVDSVNGTLTVNKVSIADTALAIREKGADEIAVVDGTINSKFLDPASITAIAAGITQGIAIVSKAVAFIAPIVSGAIAAVSFFYILKRFFILDTEKMELALHEKYLKNKEIKEWLEAHVAKLRMDLQEMNPNDPQYQKMVKIIEVYDEKIRDLDEKINEYLEV